MSSIISSITNLCVDLCRVQQAASKPTAKKEKYIKDKMKAATEAGIAVDDHGRSSATVGKNEKSRDAVHANGIVSSEPVSDKSRLHHCVLFSRRVRNVVGY